MSKKEIDRFAVLEQVRNKKLKQCQAATILGISDRQVRNLLVRVRNGGAKGLISRHRERPSNNRKPKELKKSILSLMRLKYQGFGPTFASEKLEEFEKIKIHPETLRLWMLASHLWFVKRKRTKTHPPRERRACFGELIQVDGSLHKWFGEDSPLVTLLVFIDDATSKITSLHFCKRETLNDYFTALEMHLKQYGRPRGIYSDRLKVFNGEKQLSQFQQAIRSLEIESLLAYSPQAKGRVERVNRTLQDRLVKELALRGIKTIDEANKYLPKYLQSHNNKFPIEPVSSFDAHRPLEKRYDLERLLCRREDRILSKDYVFQFHNRHYKINKVPEIRRPKGRKIEVRITRNGKMRVFFDFQELKFCSVNEIPSPIMKQTKIRWQFKKPRIVPRTHPWKNALRRHQIKEDLLLSVV